MYQDIYLSSINVSNLSKYIYIYIVTKKGHVHKLRYFYYDIKIFCNLM